MSMRSCLALTCLFFISTAANAGQFSSVQQDMSKQEFQDAGLAKLSPEQLAALNVWIKNEIAGRETAVAKATTEKAAADAAAAEAAEIGFVKKISDVPIESTIPGEFHGWHGGTEFVLENGQVWLQSSAGTLTGIKVNNPKVTIRQGLMGNWVLRVAGYNATVNVKRVK